MLKSVIPLLRIDTKMLFLIFAAHEGELKVRELIDILGLNRKEIIQIVQRLRKEGYEFEYDRKKDVYRLVSKPIVEAYVRVSGTSGNRIRGELFGIIPCEIEVGNPILRLKGDILRVRGEIGVEDGIVKIRGDVLN